MSEKLTQEYIEEEFNKEGYKLLSKYVNNRTKLLTICPNGHKWETIFSNFQQGHRCKTCMIKKSTSETCIANTDPWMIDLGMSREDAEIHTSRSGDKIVITCPHCGQQKEIRIVNMYKTKSNGCCCSFYNNNILLNDNSSFPEKFITELLNQLNIKYKREYKPEWSNGKRYDFYFEYDDKKRCIIETHGGQHYDKSIFTCCGGRTLQEEQENDELKEQLAYKNGIDYYIELDCRKSELEWIKNSVKNSELNNLFDLSNIDWMQCEEFALSNRVKEVCDYWNNKEEHETITNLTKIFNLSTSTINKCLRKGTKLGWCNYNGREQILKGMKKSNNYNIKPIMILKDNIPIDVFESAREIDRQSEELFGVKLHHQPISEVCNGKRKTYKGFIFKYITKEEYEKIK